MYLLKKIASLLTWIIFSPKCLLCKAETFEDNSLCASCWSKLSFISGNICKRCGIPLFDTNNLQCICLKLKTYYSQIRAALVYDDHSAKIIHDFKYNDNIHAKHTISKLMLNAGSELIKSANIIVPVPLHKKRLQARKYNQSLIIAKQIAGSANIKLAPDLIKRIKNTPSQSGLNTKLRKANMKEAFIINPKWKNFIRDKKILLIDDVITTGTTVNECARALKVNGASEVFVLSFARTLKSSKA